MKSNSQGCQAEWTWLMGHGSVVPMGHPCWQHELGRTQHGWLGSLLSKELLSAGPALLHYAV